MTTFDRLLLISNVITIIAILTSPIVAIWVTRKVNENKERRARQRTVYRVLMATRVSSLSPQHTEALNSIDLEFNSPSKPEEEV